MRTHLVAVLAEGPLALVLDQEDTIRDGGMRFARASICAPIAGSASITGAVGCRASHDDDPPRIRGSHPITGEPLDAFGARRARAQCSMISRM